MAQEKLIDKPLQTISRKLAADVTVANVAVVPTANEGEVKVCDTQNALIEGFLMQTGKAGQEVPIVIGGICPVQITAAVDRNVMLITSANGKVFPCAMTSGTTYNIVGKSVTKATVALEFVSVQVLPQKLRIKA